MICFDSVRRAELNLRANSLHCPAGYPSVHMIKIPKQFAVLASAVLVLGSVCAAPAEAQLKVGVVDIDKIFNEYYKTKDAEERINEARDAARKDVEARLDGRMKLLGAIAALNQDLENKSLPGPVRADTAKRRDDKIVEVQNAEREINELGTTRESQIREQAARSRSAIVEDIMKVINERVRNDGYDLVIDKSGNGVSGVAALLASKREMEFTGDVITALNKTKPAAGSATPKPAATKPAATKPAPTPKK
jgi:outer membrane protein